MHGFNVDFREVALRSAQIGFDLQLRGAMAFFSWASRGEVGKYLADETIIELKEDVIADYRCDCARNSGARRVHVIAHSTGNRAVLRAVERIAAEAQRRSGGVVSNASTWPALQSAMRLSWPLLNNDCRHQ